MKYDALILAKSLSKHCYCLVMSLMQTTKTAICLQPKANLPHPYVFYGFMSKTLTLVVAISLPI